MTTYTTRQDAIFHEIEEALGTYAAEHNIEAIADATLGDYEEGYALKVDTETFWEIVAANAL